jgi:large exoprotein involved in heme utilization and adhesion
VIIDAKERVVLGTGYIFSTVGSSGIGKGGDIRINTNLLSLTGNAQLSSSTFGKGDAGNIIIEAKEDVLLDNSGFFVLSESSGIAGDIEVNSPKVTLDNSGRINAESASGDGGNINLNISDLLLMRRGSQISTTAGTAQQGGDGGNIDINSRFIVAVPEENSDISANAFTGAGGRVQITSRGVFGIEARSQVSDRSDITASSERGVQGVTTINAPDNSGIQNSLNQLSENPIDPNALIANSCIARRNSPQNSTFFITGKGGLPERPGEAPISAFSTGTMQNVPKDGDSTKPRPWKIGDPIVEPTGVYRLANGKRVLSRECN